MDKNGVQSCIQLGQFDPELVRLSPRLKGGVELVHQMKQGLDMCCSHLKVTVSVSVKIEVDVPKIEPAVRTEIERMGAELLFFLKISEVAPFASEFFYVFSTPLRESSYVIIFFKRQTKLNKANRIIFD